MYKYLIFNCGHEALRYIVKTYGIKEMKIPYYLCDVVRHTLVEEGCKPVFYHIDDKFYLAENFSEEDYILYPNYWGICRENVEKLVKIYPKVIVDNAHAFYDKPSGFACFNAGHKFGYKESYAFIQDFKENLPPDKSQTEEAKLRHDIFMKLHNTYKDKNILDIDSFIYPFSYPFIYPCLTETVEEADELVRELKKKGKIVYRYWSPLPKSFNEYKFYSRLVPIPILPH